MRTDGVQAKGHESRQRTYSSFFFSFNLFVCVLHKLTKMNTRSCDLGTALRTVQKLAGEKNRGVDYSLRSVFAFVSH